MEPGILFPNDFMGLDSWYKKMRFCREIIKKKIIYMCLIGPFEDIYFF